MKCAKTRALIALLTLSVVTVAVAASPTSAHTAAIERHAAARPTTVPPPPAIVCLGDHDACRLAVLGKFGGVAGSAVSTVVGPVAALAFARGMCLKVKFGAGWSTPLTPFTPLPYSDGQGVCR